MNPNLVYDLVDLATTLAADFGNPENDNILVQIVQKALEAYEEHTEEPMDLAAIRPESAI